MSNVLAQRWLLNRRRFLRGAGTAVALPLLDAMTPLRAAIHFAFSTCWPGRPGSAPVFMA